MNERIKELALQSDWKSDRLTAVNAEQQDRKLQKFAELIVKECLLKVNGAKIRGESMDELIARIKEDFGVE